MCLLSAIEIQPGESVLEGLPDLLAPRLVVSTGRCQNRFDIVLSLLLLMVLMVFCLFLVFPPGVIRNGYRFRNRDKHK